MNDAYDKELAKLWTETAQELNLGQILRHGVYCNVFGPSYETIAELRLLRTLGADAVGKPEKFLCEIS